MIAVFGTILGFYFGTGESGTPTIEQRSAVEQGLLVGLAGLGVDLTDIPDDMLDEVAAIYFSQMSNSEKVAAIRALLPEPPATEPPATEPPATEPPSQ